MTRRYVVTVRQERQGAFWYAEWTGEVHPNGNKLVRYSSKQTPACEFTADEAHVIKKRCRELWVHADIRSADPYSTELAKKHREDLRRYRVEKRKAKR